MSCLFAVTTDLPALSARLIKSPAGSRPPISSTTMSASEATTVSMLSVQSTPAGTQSTFLRSTPRLQIAVNCSEGWIPLDKTFATERPTVPKPTMATRSGILPCVVVVALCERVSICCDPMRFSFFGLRYSFLSLLSRLDRYRIQKRHHSPQLRADLL